MGFENCGMMPQLFRNVFNDIFKFVSGFGDRCFECFLVCTEFIGRK